MKSEINKSDLVIWMELVATPLCVYGACGK